MKQLGDAVTVKMGKYMDLEAAQQRNDKARKNQAVVPDKNGDVELMQLFWETEMPQLPNINKTVPTLLAYAELVTSLDSRNRETAERLKQQYLD